jgi:hypothetical protein
VRTSPALRWRELLPLAFVACLLAAAMHWPVTLHPSRDVAADLGDPLVQAWQVAWVGHALTGQPLDLFQANAYWPLENSLAFSDALLGYAAAGLIGNGPVAAITRYNVLFLFSYALAFVGAYLLARELGVGRVGAAVAGAAFAYAPWRVAQLGHLHVLASGGIPLSLFFLLRGYRRTRPGIVLVGWLVATWQLLLGFTLGLQLLYLLGVLGVVAIALWWGRRPKIERSVLAATAVGVVVLVVSAFLLSRPYVEVLEGHPEARRSAREVESYSPPVRSYLAAPPDNLVWGSATGSFRETLPRPVEQTLFPGLVTAALALLGAGWGRVYPRALRLGLVVGGFACAWLALGFSEEGFPHPFEPYRVLFELAPGWEGVRTPGRINTLTSLSLALLASAGADLVVAWGRRRSSATGRRIRRAVAAAGALVVVAIVLEGAGFRLGQPGESFIVPPRHATVPERPGRQPDDQAPQLHLPFTGDMASARYVLWSTEGFPAIVNGQGSFEPTLTKRIGRRVRSFPDRRSVRFLRSLGVRTVVLHPGLVPGTAWAATAHRSVRGLPLRRENSQDVVVYHLAAGDRTTQRNQVTTVQRSPCVTGVTACTSSERNATSSPDLPVRGSPRSSPINP